MKVLSVCSGIEAASVAIHPNARDLSGLRSGRLLVKGPSPDRADGHIKWLCDCDCGRQKTIASNSLTRAKPVQSCGCMNATTAQAKRKGSWNEGKSYAIGGGEHCYKTRHGWAIAAIRHYGNKCERCGWDKARCDVHHREHKARGGLHTLSNAIVLCPNCHRIEHENEAKQCGS